jgi:hypothetical protein
MQFTLAYILKALLQHISLYSTFESMVNYVLKFESQLKGASMKKLSLLGAWVNVAAGL